MQKYFVLKNNKSKKIFSIKPKDVIVVYGSKYVGKSTFLLSVCGSILAKRPETKIIYIDLDGKNLKSAMFIKNFNDNFKYAMVKEDMRVREYDIYNYLRFSEVDVCVVDGYDKMFRINKNYSPFFINIHDIAKRKEKAIILSSRGSNPSGGFNILSTTTDIIKITRVNYFERMIREMKRGVYGEFSLKHYDGGLFFDFFINKLGGKRGLQ